jgi:peptidyl-prolyl cis-trans isomerase SurA
MKIRSFLIVLITALLPAVCPAQDLDHLILMTVGENKVEAGEFIRMYKKSLDPGRAQSIDDYLEQYILFKLKVADAVNEGYDTTRAFISELKGYRNQLAQHYLTDTETKEELLEKAYQRSLTEINAWHILVSIPQPNSPDDTLKAWQKAFDIRERILKGEPFEQVARGTSDDQSVKVNGGNLGYFTAFQMIMPFEDAAFSLNTGAVSLPVRTPYGYHIIKVIDKRPSKGKVRVAHIMKAAPPSSNENEAKTAEKEINIIYNKLEGGASFSELAKQYSDHKESATAGGELNWFGAGEIISDFSEAAFMLKDTGEYTKPVKTIYGWHIIKLLEKKPNSSFEESKSYLESKINQSYLNSLSKKSFIDKLKKEYNFKINENALNWFILNTDTLVIQGLKRINRSGMPAGNLYTFADQRYTTREFANYIDKRGAMILTNDSSVYIKSSLETRASDHILSYENSVLENKYPEFRYLMNEFHDGILLFEVSGKKIWNRLSEDSTGIRQYYEANKNNYLTSPAIDAKIYTLRSADGEKLLTKTYKKFSRKSNTDTRLTAKFNKTDSLLYISEKIWYKGDDKDIDNIKWEKGEKYFFRNGFPSVILIKEVIDPVPLEFEKIHGEMMAGYQEMLENEWIKQLKEKYTVKINNIVLEEVKKKLKNE